MTEKITITGRMLENVAVCGIPITKASTYFGIETSEKTILCIAVLDTTTFINLGNTMIQVESATPPVWRAEYGFGRYRLEVTLVKTL